MIALLEVFYSPGAVFDRVRERGTWWPPLAAIVVVGLLAGALMMNMISMSTIVRKQLESNPQTVERLGPDGIERVANNPAYKVLGYAGAIGLPIVIVAISGILMGALSITGQKVSFKQVLGATAYAWWPYYLLVTAMTMLIVYLSADRSDLNFKNLVATNVGAFLDPQTTSKPLYSLASSLDLLSFGLILFISYGLSRVSKVRMGTCAAIVFGIWAIYVLAKAGSASLF
ncbi:MAG: hypothetical protein JWO80_637 [Bryobacterales bacterium]|nr:hypothetical protein [Bryobacterales bacterium]